MFRRPEIGVLLSLLLTFYFFGFLNPNLVAIKGIFRTSDLAILPLFIVLLMTLSQEKDLAYVLGSPIAKAMILLIGTVILVGVYTTIFYNISPVWAFKTGRVYLYYALFFPVAYLIRRKEQLNWLIYSFFWILIVFSLLYLLNFVIGSKVKIFPFRSEVLYKSGIIRTGVYGDCLPAFVLGSMLGILLYNNSKKLKKIAIGATLLFVLQTVATLGRAHWFGTVMGIGLTLLLISKKRIQAIKIISFSSILFIGMSIMIGTVFLHNPTVILSETSKRFKSAITDIEEISGTYEYRYEQMVSFARLIEKRPLIGIGFLHQEKVNFLPEAPHGLVRDIHVGLLNILIDMGMVGVIVFAILLFTFFKRAFFVFKNIRNSLYKGIIFGFIATFLGRLFSYTLATFSEYEKVAYLALTMAIMEIMYRIDLEETKRASNHISKRPLVLK